MKSYNVFVNGKGWVVDASNRATAVKKGLHMYFYQDADAPAEELKSRRSDKLPNKEITINIRRVK